MNPYKDWSDDKLLKKLDILSMWRTEYSTNAAHNAGYLPEEEAEAAADNEREYDLVWNEAYDRCLLPSMPDDYEDED